MWSSTVLPSLAVLFPLACAFDNDAYTVFERLNAVPKGWTQDSVEPDPNDAITLRIHVKQQNVEKFEKKLIDVWLH